MKKVLLLLAALLMIPATASAERYASAGVVELGGSAGLQRASDVTSLQLSPQVGWFVADGLELSVIGGLNYTKFPGGSAKTYGAAFEPSYHLALTDSTFLFVGVGVGAAHVDTRGTVLAVDPRVGINWQLGCSSLLTLSVYPQRASLGFTVLF